MAITETKQPKKFELRITADNVTSTDKRFTMDDLGLGDNYKPLEAYFLTADGEIVRRARNKGERNITNQTMPRIACQLFEKQISALSAADRENFPVCQYRPNDDVIRGIFPTKEELFEARKTTSLEFVKYENKNTNTLYFFYCWNIFSTIFFVRECLKCWGQPNDQFVLIYREKTDKEKKKSSSENPPVPQPADNPSGFIVPYSQMLLESKNIILRGAPGTGKTYLAKQIAADIVSDGYYDDFNELSDEQKSRVGFVQFHPSYDYTDFVEGLRPTNGDGAMGFELRDGVFMEFVKRARENFENSQKSTETLEKELSVEEAIEEFFSNIKFGVDKFKTKNGNEFTIENFNDKHIYIYIPNNPKAKSPDILINKIVKMLDFDGDFNDVKDVKEFFKEGPSQTHSYLLPIYNKIKDVMKTKKAASTVKVEQEELKKYVFIIDEINRGEISKILGELFFSIDPGYRGEAGAVSTQYANLHDDRNEKFYIPENVYIIGTMNDIDRSVDTFDFAMRRRFRFVEIKADENLEMLDVLGEELKDEAIERMTALNNEIANTEDLNENYQIGAAYFLKLKELGFDKLWEDYLEPLLREYVRGMYDEKRVMEQFAKAYGYEGSTDDN
ncbi:MAG: AAA family ATPase [Oscillospiraceae bacterium]|nr:AAA family ATPase [Oscillospiraceae bacterium]